MGPGEEGAGNEEISALTCCTGAGVHISSLPGLEQEFGAVSSTAEVRTLAPCLFALRCLLCLKMFSRSCDAWVPMPPALWEASGSDTEAALGI